MEVATAGETEVIEAARERGVSPQLEMAPSLFEDEEEGRVSSTKLGSQFASALTTFSRLPFVMAVRRRLRFRFLRVALAGEFDGV